MANKALSVIWRYIFIPAMALVVTAVIYSMVAPLLKKEDENKVLIGGDFNLTNQYGEQVTNQTYKGKYMLVYFGFTNCPHICPTDLSNITEALNNLDEGKIDNITPVFITVDPERDDVERMKIYSQNFHEKLQALTGTDSQIKQAIASYRVYSKKEEDSEVEGYNMNHSAYIYLMDKEGNYVTHFAHGQPVKEIVRGLNKYL